MLNFVVGIAGECAMHAIRAVVGPDIYTEQAGLGWCKIFSVMLSIIIPAAVAFEMGHKEKAHQQSVQRCQMVKDSINTCVVCVRLQAEKDSGVKSNINQLCGFCLKGTGGGGIDPYSSRNSLSRNSSHAAQPAPAEQSHHAEGNSQAGLATPK